MKEKLNPQKEVLRVNTIEDYYLFQRLIAETKLNDLVDIWFLNIAGTKLFTDPPYLEAARTCIRIMALQKEGCLSIRPVRDGFHLFSSDKIITCRDIKNKMIYEGDIADCPLPALDLLSQAGMGNDWHRVCSWNLGNIKDLKSHQTSTGCLLLKEPGVFLFTDELSKLVTGEFVTVQKHQPWVGFISMTFEGYQIINGEIFRIWADYTD